MEICMGYFNNPIRGKDDDRYRAEPIEKDKKGREPFAQLPGRLEEKHPFFLGKLLYSLYKNVMRFLTFHSRVSAENLYSIRKIFQILQQEDRSQDPDLLNELSEVWGKIHDDLHHLNKKSDHHSPFQRWFSMIDSYPEGQEFSLGYYLSQHAGLKWLPFPYMEMIHTLHIQHQKSPYDSTLAHWISSTDLLLSLLNQD